MQRRQAICSLLRFAGLSSFAIGFDKAVSQTSTQGENTILIGQSGPFSGPEAQTGLQYFYGARLYFEALNARGGVHGRQIEFRRLDDAGSPERCANNSKQFVKEGAFALFGYVGTDTARTALPIAQKAGIPLFAPLSGAPELRDEVHQVLFHIRASSDEEADALVRQATLLGLKRMAIAYQDQPQGHQELASLKLAMKKANLEPVATVLLDQGGADIAKAVESILIQRPDVIMQLGNFRVSARFIRHARQRGYTGSFYNMSNVGTQALSDELGAVAKGVAISQVMPYPYSTASSIAREYQKAHLNVRGIVPNYIGMEGFVAAKTFSELLNLAGKNASPQDFIAAANRGFDLDLGEMKLTFSSKRREGSHFVDITLLSGDGRILR